MNMYQGFVATAVLTCAALAVPVFAKAEVVASLTARKVIAAPDGKPAFQSAEKASPGDVIEYQAVYTNQNKGAIKNLVPTMPIPTGMEYVPGSAKPAQVLASLDGKKFEPVPLKRMVTLPNGKQESRDVPYSEYRALRWNGTDLAGNGSFSVSARTKMSDVASSRSNDAQVSSARPPVGATRKGGKS
jgi:uncharacterized repeat protein (TIGR01451 family)